MGDRAGRLARAASLRLLVSDVERVESGETDLRSGAGHLWHAGVVRDRTGARRFPGDRRVRMALRVLPALTAPAGGLSGRSARGHPERGVRAVGNLRAA